MRYLAGGKMGDFIHMMFVCEYIFSTTGEKADIYLSNSGDAFEYGVNIAYEDLKPIMQTQSFVNTFNIYNGEQIDVDLNKFRESPYLYQSNWLEIYSNTFLQGVKIPTEYSWIDLPKDNKYSNSLMINRSITNNIIDNDTMIGYETLIQDNKFDAIYFLCFNEKQFDNFPLKDKVKILKVDTLYDFFIKIRSCKFFIGNQSGPFAWASSMNIPRALETHPTIDRIHYMRDKIYYKNFYLLNELTHMQNISNISLLVGLKNNLDYNKNFYTTTRELYPDVEICFVSYGSTDKTHEWLDELKDDNLKYFYSEESKTFSDTFNKAAELSTKDYVVYLHNDIVLAPNFLENIEKHLSENNAVSYTTIEPPIFSGHKRPGKIIHDLGSDLQTFNKEKMYEFAKEKQVECLNKTEPGITFFMCMPKKVLLEIGGMDNLFNPMFCEDDDLVHRFKMYGLNLFTALDAICYHFVSKTSRFSEEYQLKTKQIEHNSNKNFIRKWGFRNSKHNKKYNIGFKVYNCNQSLLELLEVWCDIIWVSENIIEEYIQKEQVNTKYDLKKRVHSIENSDAKDYMDITVEFDAKNFTQDSFNIIQNLSDIITESGEVGEFTLDCFTITIQQLETYEKNLIRLV